MPTAGSWTDLRGDLRRDLDDLRALVAFRWATVRGRSRRRVAVAWLLIAAITAAAIVVPAFSGPAGTSGVGVWEEFLAPGFGAFLLMAAGAAVATGGGRELLSREQAVAYPVTPATDHFGSLLMAPLNIAWLLQLWMLLGLTSYVGGAGATLTGPPVVLAWVALTTALGQIAGWVSEWVRRGPHGVLRGRLLLVALGGAGALAAATGHAVDALTLVPTDPIAETATGGGPLWPVLVAGLLLATVAAVLAGIPVAAAAMRRPPREEQRLESGHHRMRRVATGPADAWGDLRTLVALDRASVWRSLPLRRGLIVLAVLPGLGAIISTPQWDVVVLLPGLVAAAVALLFGVNTWSLDGRGALWRESLPVAPGLVFAARSVVLAEMILGAVAVTLLVAATRAGAPTGQQALALLCAVVVVTLQVVATSARWSVRGPFSVDLRSARAVAAPPSVMLGYSARLSLGTTITGMVFSALSGASNPLALLVAMVPFLIWSAVRLRRARRAWLRPPVRAHVVATVAA